MELRPCGAVRGRVRGCVRFAEAAGRCALRRHRDARPYEMKRLHKCRLLSTFGKMCAVLVPACSERTSSHLQTPAEVQQIKTNELSGELN